MRYFLPTLKDSQDRIYQCEEIPIHPSMGDKAFRVYKPDGSEQYDVHLTPEGTVECGCGDFQMRKKGTALLCKHGKAIVVAGLLCEPDPKPNH